MPAQSEYAVVPRPPDSEWREHHALGWPSNWHWPNGVPANQLGEVVTSDGTKIVVLRDLVELYQLLIQIAEQKLGYKCAGGGFTGGYVNKQVTGGRGPSSHSRARAMDINAQKNPQSWTFQSDMPVEMVRIWASLGMYWGGWYVGVKYDPMHWFFNEDRSTIPMYVARAREIFGSAGTVTPAPAPGQPAAPAYPLSGGQVFGRWNEPGGWAKKTRSGDPRWDGGDIRASIKTLQQRLIAHGVVPGISDPGSGWADGLYESPTTEAVRRFQAARGLAVDGMVGPVTWADLWR